MSNHAPDHAPASAPAGDRLASKSRPAKSLGCQEADRIFAEILDDAIRIGERADVRFSNEAIGAAAGVDERKVRAWRDPHDARNMPAARLLQLPDEICRSVIERLLAVRVELRGDVLPSREVALTLAINSAGTFIARAARGVLRPNLCDGERDEIARNARVLVRDLRRLLAVLGSPSSLLDPPEL